MMNRKIKIVAFALSLILASSALSSVAMAQNAERENREDVNELMNEADRLAEKARTLLSRAEEHGNKASIDEIESAFKWLNEAKNLTEDGDLERAKAALGEARKHLAKAERLLGASDTAKEEVLTETAKEEVLAKAKHLMERAMKLESLTKSQDNERALEVVDRATDLIEEAVRIADDNARKANTMLDEATRMLNAAEAMLSATTTGSTPIDTDYKENVVRKAKHLMERAEHLQSIAEKQGNEKALEAIHEVMRILEEVVELASQADVREANAMLGEATKMLNRMAAMLVEPTTARPTRLEPISADSTNTLMRIADEFESKAKRIMSLAEEQGKKEAFAEAEVGLKLVTEAKMLIEERNYDDVKAKLREASDHLSKASRMLQPDEVTKTERKISFIKDRHAVVDNANNILKVRFGLDGNGYAVIKHSDTSGALFGTEISLHGAALEERKNAIHFVVNDVVITADASTLAMTANEGLVTLTSVDVWDGKARRGGVFFVTSGTVQDDNGTLYRANLRGLLIDASEQGLVYKVDGRIHNTDRTNADQDYLFANLHYLAIVKAVA